MKSVVLRATLACALISGLPGVVCAAPEAAKALPTLLIKGEVVSLDSNDPSANLLKVKDRYGFETPIFVTPETKIVQGEVAATVATLTTGAEVEVEYNFDVNTAKRHAVSVKVASAAPAAAPAAAAVPAVAPATEAAPVPAAAPAASAASPASAPMATPAPAATPAAPSGASSSAPASQ